MKAPLFSMILVASAAPFAVAAEVAPGASLDEVRATLGTPKGQVNVGGRQLVYYDRGEVELQHGRVVRVGLRTAEEQATQVAREERLRADQESRREQLMAEGIAIRDRKLADATFLAAPVAYQVAFWENFTRSHPGVPCVEPLTIARLKLNAELDEKQRRDEEFSRLAELEARFAATEQRPQYRVVRPYARQGRRYHQEFALGPVTYTYYDAPLPVYTTPTTPLIDPFRGDLAQPERRVYSGQQNKKWGHADRHDHRDHREWRGADRGRGARRDRF